MCYALQDTCNRMHAPNCCARSSLVSGNTHQLQVGAHDGPVHAGVAALCSRLSWVPPWAMLPAV